MSNDLTIMGNELALLPGGKAVEIINAPLRAIAAPMRVAARCRDELDEVQQKRDSIMSTNPMLSKKSDEVYCEIYHDEYGHERRRARTSEASSAFLALVRIEEAKLIRATLLPRFFEVRQAFDLLSSICEGGQEIDSSMALRMLSVLHRVLQKKKDDPITLMSYASLFDKDIDSLGVSLNLWKEVPRHPVVVAGAIQYLFHKQVFTPAPAELCSACRRVGSTLKARYWDTMHWLDKLSKADAELYHKDRDQWARIYTTPESLAAAPVLGWCSYGWVSEEDIWARDNAIREMISNGEA